MKIVGYNQLINTLKTLKTLSDLMEDFNGSIQFSKISKTTI